MFGVVGVVRSCSELFGVVRSCSGPHRGGSGWLRITPNNSPNDPFSGLFGVVRSCSGLFGVVRGPGRPGPAALKFMPTPLVDRTAVGAPIGRLPQQKNNAYPGGSSRPPRTPPGGPRGPGRPPGGPGEALGGPWGGGCKPRSLADSPPGGSFKQTWLTATPPRAP